MNMEEELNRILKEDEFQKGIKSKPEYILHIGKVAFAFGNKNNAVKFCDMLFQEYGIKLQLRSLTDYEWDKNPDKFDIVMAKEKTDIDIKIDPLDLKLSFTNHMMALTNVADQLGELSHNDSPLDKIGIAEIQHDLTTRKNRINMIPISKLLNHMSIDEDQKQLLLKMEKTVIKNIDSLLDGLNSIKEKKGL